MAREVRFQFPLTLGLHARPASHVQAAANRFKADVRLLNSRNGKSANAKSVLSMVSADVRLNDACVLTIHGADEDLAERELRNFVEVVLPDCDDELPEVSKQNGEMLLPRSLRAAGLADYYRGVTVSTGIGWGKVAVLNGLSFGDGNSSANGAHGDAQQEHDRFDSARRVLRASLEDRIAASTSTPESEVLGAHLAILDDAALGEKVATLINEEALSAAQALRQAADFFIATLQNSGSAYLRERVLDLQDVCGQLLDALTGTNGNATRALRLDQPSICVADRLTPGQFLALDRRLLRGLVLREAGTTSHTVILARSMNVPTMVGVNEASTRLQSGQEVIMDANLGIVIPQITDPLRRYYELEIRKLQTLEQRRAACARRLPSTTSDGLDMEIAANVVSADEISAAMEAGADGIGLFRTEMLFVDRQTPPGEEEQFEIYRRAARAAHGSPLMIRLLDIGGDKPAPYLKVPAEANPFLGYRGVRVYAEHAELLRTQVRAILRAAEWGDVKILVPMICCVEELRAVKQVIKDVRDELARAGTPCEAVPVGIMLEVPSCAFLMDELCREADFFSIGSNDLAQYFLAADRDNGKVSDIYTWTHPAFLRLLQQIVDSAHERGKWIGLCGEMADTPAALPLLIALGLDEISLSSTHIASLRHAVCQSEFARCTQMLEQAVRCSTRAQVESLLEDYTPSGQPLPLLSSDLLLQSQAISKAEVIKEMSDALWLCGRAREGQLLEEAVWQREDAYSTGFGYGFALPHCKSEQVTANSIVVAKLDNVVEWGSTDKRPVDVAILVAMRSADYEKSHMRVFAQLSRLVMRDEFRDRVRDLDGPELLSFLKEALGLDAVRTP
jgi:fructose-specific PTS system IIA-like component